MAASVLLCLAGSTLVLLAAGRPWGRAVLRQPPLPTVAVAATGRSLVPLAAALGLVGLAGVVAVLATRGVGRVATGVLLALSGALVTTTSLRTQLRLESAVRPVAERVAGVPGGVLSSVRVTAWPTISVAGGVLLCAAGLLVAVRGRRWSTLSARYEPPGEPPTAPATAPTTDSETSVWVALDRGEDPTR